MNQQLTRILVGGDQRSLKGVEKVMEYVTDQESFDELFSLIFHHDRKLSMRAADAVEKITRRNFHYLTKHTDHLLALLHSNLEVEKKWHVAQLLCRVDINAQQLQDVWSMLTHWALNPNESKIVRVNALDALYRMSLEHSRLKENLDDTVKVLKTHAIPSLQARIKKLKL